MFRSETLVKSTCRQSGFALKPARRFQLGLQKFFNRVQETLIEEESGDESDPDSPVKSKAADAKAPDSREQPKQSRNGSSPPQGPGRNSPSRLKKSTAPDSGDV